MIKYGNFLARKRLYAPEVLSPDDFFARVQYIILKKDKDKELHLDHLQEDSKKYLLEMSIRKRASPSVVLQLYNSLDNTENYYIQGLSLIQYTCVRGTLACLKLFCTTPEQKDEAYGILTYRCYHRKYKERWLLQ